MQRKIRFLVLPLLVLLVLPLFAGGQKASSAAAKVPVKASGQYPIGDQPITISVLMGHVATVSDMIDNSFTRSFEQKLGVKLNMVLEDTAGGGGTAKRELLFNTGDYPELILYNGGNSTADVSKYGMTEHIYIPLEPYLEQYGKNILKMFDRFPGMREGYTAPDGHIYSIGSPVETTVFHENAGVKMWINTGWLDKLGLKMPTTTDEYLAVLRAFKTRDPNGNGRADEIPLTGAINTWNAEPYQFLVNCFTYWFAGDPYGPVKLSRGQITGVADTAAFREGLRYSRQLFSEGLYDPAAFTQTEDQMNQLGASNPTIIGSFSGGHIAMAINIQNPAVYNNFDGLSPLKGSNGYQGTPYRKSSYYAGTRLGGAITDKCKNPEAAMRIIDELFVFETYMNARFGPKGSVWDYPDPGAKTVLGDPATWKALPGLDNATSARNDYWHDGAFGPFIPTDFQFGQFTGNIRDSNNYEAYLKKVTQDYQKYAADAEDFKAMWADAETIVSLRTSAAALNTFVKSAVTEFITGTRNIETGWDAYLRELEQLGYSAYIKELSTTYFVSTK